MTMSVKALPPLVLLPRNQWTLRPLNDVQVGVGIFSRGGALYLQKWSVHDFPNAFFGIPDLEDAGLLEVYVRAVEQLVHGAPSMPGDAAIKAVELGHVRPEYDGVASAIVSLCGKALNFLHRLLPNRGSTGHLSHVCRTRGR